MIELNYIRIVLRPLTFIMFLLPVVSCSNDEKKNGEPCDCQVSIEIRKVTSLEENELPKDLTCVVANGGTIKDLIINIEKLYNDLYEKQLDLNKESESWKELKTKINDWLGGAYVGQCGNLYNGLKIKNFNKLGEPVNIEIKVVNLELERTNGLMEKPPFDYQGYVTYSVSVSTDNNQKASKVKPQYTIVISTCNRYLEIK